MDLQNKQPAAIQEEIYNAIAQGIHPDVLKAELKQQGHHPEAYYFTTAAQREREAAQNYQEPGSSSEISPTQIILTVISVALLIFKIARCSSRM